MNSDKTNWSICSLNNENCLFLLIKIIAKNKIKKFNNPNKEIGAPYKGGNNAYWDLFTISQFNLSLMLQNDDD